jgi:MoaA/NifB/PqqE/SkfB family radical SAM enzyme
MWVMATAQGGNPVNFKGRLAQLKSLLGIMHGSMTFSGPIQATLLLTNRCNLRCIHCYFYSPHIKRPNMYQLRSAKVMNLELSDEYIKSLQTLDADSKRSHAIIDELIAMGTQSFIFSGNGEPFLHNEIFELISRAKSAGCECIANTNGTLLNPVIIDELVTKGFDELKITTMAGTPEMYVQTHSGVKPEIFLKLRDNLIYLADRKSALGVKKPLVSLVFIVISENCDGIAEFIDFAISVRADQVLFRPIDDVEDPGLRKLVPTPAQAGFVREQLMKAKSYLASRNIGHNIDFFLKAFREQLDTKVLYDIIPCYYGWLWVRIDEDGLVYPCCRCYKPLGNIYEKKFHEIWNGSAYQQFRQESLHINRRKSPVNGCDCYSCAHFTANFRIYQKLHPIKGCSKKFEEIFLTMPGN